MPTVSAKDLAELCKAADLHNRQCEGGKGLSQVKLLRIFDAIYVHGKSPQEAIHAYLEHPERNGAKFLRAAEAMHKIVTHMEALP